MPVTYDAIATSTLGTSAASITFNSIPATYTDLEIVLAGVRNGTGDTGIQFNGDTGSNYSDCYLRGNGSTASSLVNNTATYIGCAIAAPNGQSTFIKINVFDYKGTTKKSVLSASHEDLNGATGWVGRISGLWANTAAINSVTIFCSNTWNAGTVATIYGIKAA